MTGRQLSYPPLTDPFAHPALFYESAGEFLEGVGTFVRNALEADEPVFVAVPGDRLRSLHEHLGSDAASVECADMTVLGRNPGRILAALQDFADRYPGRPVSIVGEPIWAGRSAAEILEATRHEALINTAFTGRTAAILCPYDTTRLPTAALADAYRTHPTLIENGHVRASSHYTDPAVVSDGCDAPLSDPPAGRTFTFPFLSGQLAEVRRHAVGWMQHTSLSEARRSDLLLAIAEATGNSVAHGGGGGVLRLWTTGAHGCVAEVSDSGYLANPLAGRRKPGLATANGGRGLWMIHQLCDLVEIRARSMGLVLRMHMSPPLSQEE